jgi:hypothetical protein
MPSEIKVVALIASLGASSLIVLQAPADSTSIRLGFGDKCMEEME